MLPVMSGAAAATLIIDFVTCFHKRHNQKPPVMTFCTKALDDKTDYFERKKPA